MRLNFQPSIEVSGEVNISFSCIRFLSSVHVSSRTCHRSIQTSNSSHTCSTGAPCLATVLNILEDIPHQSPIVNNLIGDVSLAWYQRLCYHCINLWLLRDSLPAIMERLVSLVYLRGCITILFLPLVWMIFCFTYLGLDWFSAPLVFTIPLFQPFWNVTMISRLQINLSCPR